MNFSELISLFSLPFMQRAIIGGILLGILGGILGGFVILRQLSLFGNALGGLRRCPLNFIPFFILFF